MTREEAIAHVRRLCPPGTLEALGRPSGGHAIGALAPRRAAVEEQAATGSDPRAERDEPARRERRPSSTSQQIAAVTAAHVEHNDALAARLEKP